MKKIVWGITLSCFLLAAFFIIEAFDNASSRKALKLMVTKRPERVSELYFTNYAAIPKKLRTNRLYKIDFTIKNREYQHKVYAYRIIMYENKNPIVIGTRKIGIHNNQSSKQQIQFRTTKPNAAIKIIVLLNKNQKISFKTRT